MDEPPGDRHATPGRVDARRSSDRLPSTSIQPGFRSSTSPVGVTQVVADPPARASDLSLDRRVDSPIYSLSYRDEFWARRQYEDRCDRIALRALLPSRGECLVDVGAGFGRLADEYAQYDHVALVDASPVMIDAARSHTAGDRRFDVIKADASWLPLRSRSADAVVAVRLLVHLGEPAETFREIARVLRPGGALVIEFPNRRHLLAVIRYALRRQSWSPFDRAAHEYLPGHFAHHPDAIEAALRSVGLEPRARRSVSLFRASIVKRVVPLRLLAAAERSLQAPLGGLLPGPSVFVLASRPGDSDTASITSPGGERS